MMKHRLSAILILHFKRFKSSSHGITNKLKE